MVDTYSAQPLSERDSQNLNVWGYLKEQAFLSIPAIGAATGYLVGRVGKNKFFPFDGSPIFSIKALEGLSSKASKKFIGESIHVDEVERMPYVKPFYKNRDDQVQAARSVWNTLKGVEVATIPFLYFLWRREEKQGLDFVEAHNKLDALGDIKPTNEELQLEKRSLQQQLDFVQGKTDVTPTRMTSASSISLEGNVAADMSQEINR